MKAVCRKLNQESGFSLSEMLAAVLILLMVSGVVAAGIPAASNAYTKAVDAANAQVLLSTAATALRDELGTAQDVTASGTTVKYYSADTGNYSEISPGPGKETGQTVLFVTSFLGDTAESTTYGSGTTGSGDSAESVQWALVSNAAVTKKLSLTYTGVEYENGLIRFSNLNVTKNGKQLAKLETLVIDVVSAA